MQPRNKTFRGVAAIVVASVMLSACSGSGIVGAHRYSAYGVINQDQNKNPNIIYRVSVWNCILGVVFIETIVVPIVVVGWQLFVPDKTAGSTDPSKRGIES